MSRRDPPEVRQARGSAAPIPGKCGSKLALTDPPRYCIKWPLDGRTRCKQHGGNSPAGTESPHFKHGRDSRYGYLVGKTAKSYQRALQDEQLMDLTPDIAMLDVAVEDAAKAMDVGASARAWASLRPLVERLKTATSKRRRDAIIAEIEALIAEGDRDGAAERLAATLEKRSRLVTTRQRLMIETESLVSVARIRTLMSGIAVLVREFIEDDGQRAEFRRRFIGYIGPRLRERSLPDRSISAVADAGSEPVGRGAGDPE